MRESYGKRKFFQKSVLPLVVLEFAKKKGGYKEKRMDVCRDQ